MRIPPARYSTRMDLGLEGKCILLIGAGRGLGGAAAVAIARERAQVAVVARTRADVEARARECEAAGAQKALAIVADATDGAQLDAAIEQTVAKLGGIDALVTLVGGSQPGGSADLSDADWRSVYDRNLWPAIRASRSALPHLELGAARRGFPKAIREMSVILHVASIYGREGGGTISYNTAKAALISLAHEQARELASRGIRVLSLAPGSILRPGGSWERRKQADPAGIAAFVQTRTRSAESATAKRTATTMPFLAGPRPS